MGAGVLEVTVLAFWRVGMKERAEHALQLMLLGLSPEIKVTWTHGPPSGPLPMASGSPHGDGLLWNGGTRLDRGRRSLPLPHLSSPE